MTTTDVVEPSIWQTYRQHGYFFREAAMLTISIGVVMHLYRVIFGDELALRYVVTPTTDKVLLVPMTYAAITGILVWHRVAFANGWALHGIGEYISASVPLHVYCSYVINDVSVFTWFPMWFSYLLLVRGVSGVPDNVLAAAVQVLMPPTRNAQADSRRRNRHPRRHRHRRRDRSTIRRPAGGTTSNFPHAACPARSHHRTLPTCIGRPTHCSPPLASRRAATASKALMTR